MAPEAGSCQLPKRVTVVENKGGGGQGVQLALKTQVEVAKLLSLKLELGSANVVREGASGIGGV